MDKIVSLILRPVASEKYPVSKIVGTAAVNLDPRITKYAQFKKMMGANIYYEIEISQGQLRVLLGSRWCRNRGQYGKDELMENAALFVRALLKEVASEITSNENLRYSMTAKIAVKIAAGKDEEGARILRSRWNRRKKFLRAQQKILRTIVVGIE